MAEFPLLHQAVAPVLTWTRQTALPFWGSVGVDEQRGGFHERLDLTGQPVLNAPKRLMVQGRQLYVYSHAAMLGWHDDGKRLAERCVEYLLSSFYQADGKPGWVFALAPDGSIANPMRDGYGHAFVLLGLAWYYRLTRDAQVLTVIDNTIGFLDEGLASPKGGYRDAEPAPDAIRRQNPHMHLLEAFLALYEATGRNEYRDHALQMFELFKTQFFRPATGTLCEYLTDELAPQPGPKGDIVEPGHHYEWVWLLRQLQRLTGESVDGYTAALYKHADTHGWDGEGLIVDELGSAGNVITASRRSWPLTEAAKANIAEGERARGTFDEKAAHCFTSLAGRFLQRPIPAGWMDRITASGEPMAEFMPASTLYHVFCATAEAAGMTKRS
jgi:mannose/cellobiose epimerase-like protein (N-acyl-D-glucosamine 2-epimerase family)